MSKWEELYLDCHRDWQLEHAAREQAESALATLQQRNRELEEELEMHRNSLDDGIEDGFSVPDGFGSIFSPCPECNAAVQVMRPGEVQCPRCDGLQFEQEEDGRWIAERPSAPGVMAYGKTKRQAAILANRILQEVRAAALLAENRKEDE
jgi:predicted RNase H-like HicB family nuclease